ncbi:MAG: YeeE/YedE family protein [Xanthobacteraceae bacterium]|nr:YeeE/YedE family protein [Xanthobacteraceae bacterium]MBY0612998.1 YeeE/YedE family protein [Beijerinckiaceae bacterium]
MDYLLVSVFLCLFAGSAIDTGTICVVRAAGDLAIGKPAIAISVLVAVACASLVFYFDTEFDLQRRAAPWFYPTFLTLAGAAVFAFGALVNGACALGTMGRLARGDVSYLATLVGGGLVGLVLAPVRPSHQAAELPHLNGLYWLLIVLAFTLVIVVFTYKRLQLSRLSAYATLGVTGALINNLQGDWTWLSLIEEVRSGMSVNFAVIACIVALLAGAMMTAVFKGHFHLVKPDPRLVIREATGGGLMAAGANLIPGGNDVLLIYGLPSGSPHAVAAYVVMFALILVVLRISPLFRQWADWKTAAK